MPMAIAGKTGVIEARVDYRIVASLARWAAHEGVPFTSRGELLRVVLETFHDLLVSTGKATPVATVEEAIEILNLLGLPFLDRGGRKRMALAESLLETREEMQEFLRMRKVVEHIEEAEAEPTVMSSEAMMEALKDAKEGRE